MCQPYTWRYLKEGSQQVERSDYPPLFITCEITSGVPCPVCGFPVQENHGNTGESPVEGQDAQEAGAHEIQEKAKRTWFVQS